MHRPTFLPACWTDTATERCGWSRDRGRACANAYSPAGVEILLRHTPTCHGCRRLIRAWEIIEGAVTPDVPGPRGPGARGDNPAAGASQAVAVTSEPSEAQNAPDRGLAPKSYLHELTETEWVKIHASGVTFDGLASRFTGPGWCASQESVISPYGCWALTAFGSSRIRVRGQCEKCSEFRGEA